MQTAILPKLAVLGPLGSHSYQLAYSAFGSTVKYQPCKTNGDVFDAVSEDVPFAVIPQENSNFGIVTETYDRLRLPEAGRRKFVRAEVTHRVRHSLLVRNGVKFEEVTVVLSHEQALGQCRRFLREHLPKASLKKLPSTAAAAQALFIEPGNCAAICSRVCAALYPGLDILYEDIQDKDAAENVTRFYILAASLNIPLPLVVPGPQQRRALLRISYGDADPACPLLFRKPNIMELIAAIGLPTIRFDRRPSLAAEVFQDVYFAELQERQGDETTVATDNVDSWSVELESAVERVKRLGADAVVLGTWGGPSGTPP